MSAVAADDAERIRRDTWLRVEEPTHFFVVEQDDTADIGLFVGVLGCYSVTQPFDGCKAGYLS
jgi:hypothetical protein